MRFRSTKQAAAFTTVAVIVLAGSAWLAAQRGGKPPSRATRPTGPEIAAAARAGRLDHGNVGTATMFGKSFKFTPVQVATEKDTADARKGLFVGVLENGAPGDETGLPVGKYNLFAAHVGGQWKCYAEANGEIVREAIRTTVTDAQPGAKAPPRFTERGWCVAVYDCAQGKIYLDGSWWWGCSYKRYCF